MKVKTLTTAEYDLLNVLLAERSALIRDYHYTKKHNTGRSLFEKIQAESIFKVNKKLVDIQIDAITSTEETP